jgi:hypothetical protein
MFQVEICSQQLEICKSVCMIIILSIVVETDYAEVCTHTFLTMIIEESVCFMSCEPILFCNYSSKKHQPRQNGSDGIRTRCKSAGVAKQRLYDQDDDTMIEQLYKFVVYKVYLM